MRHLAIFCAASLCALAPSNALSQRTDNALAPVVAARPASTLKPAIRQVLIRNRGQDAVIVVLSRRFGARPFYHAEQLVPGGRAIVDVPQLPSVLAGIVRRDELVRAAGGKDKSIANRNISRMLRIGAALDGSRQGGRKQDQERQEQYDRYDDRESNNDDNPERRGDSSSGGRRLLTGVVLGAGLDKARKKPEPARDGPAPGDIVLIDADEGSGGRVVHGVEFTTTVDDAEGVEGDPPFAEGNTTVAISNEPAPAANAAPAPCYCGPDVTAAYIEALKRVHDRIDALPDSEKGMWDGAWFLSRNGGTLDLRARPVRIPGFENLPDDAEQGSGYLCPSGPCADLPGPGGTTVSLFGVCLPQHVGNDIMYGYVGTRLGMPRIERILGGHYAQLTAYGSGDPPESHAAYDIGANIASLDADTFNVDNVGPLFREATYTSYPANATAPPTIHHAVRFIQDSYPALADCPRCPTDATQPGTLLRDWSKSSWQLDDGSQVLPPGAETESSGE